MLQVGGRRGCGLGGSCSSVNETPVLSPDSQQPERLPYGELSAGAAAAARPAGCGQPGLRDCGGRSPRRGAESQPQGAGSPVSLGDWGGAESRPGGGVPARGAESQPRGWPGARGRWKLRLCSSAAGWLSHRRGKPGSCGRGRGSALTAPSRVLPGPRTGPPCSVEGHCL